MRWVDEMRYSGQRHEVIGDRVRAMEPILDSELDKDIVVPIGTLGTVTEVVRGHWPWVKWDNGHECTAGDGEAELLFDFSALEPER